MDLHWERDADAAVAALKQRGYRILAADFGPGSLPLDEVPLTERVALVLGSEQEGVSRKLRAEADALFHVPTVGFTSYLNVSVTAGMALYEVDRRQREAGLRRPLDEAERAALRPAWYAALAGTGADRRRDYAAWCAHPPAPLPPEKDVPSREKAREEA
jgi:tRNA C32,U32 (ribose-2'-O)-methylase TrmJ